MYKNKEDAKAQNRRWRLANLEKVKASQKKSAQKRKEAVRAYQKKYNAEHKDRVQAASRRSYEKNKEAIREKHITNRADNLARMRRTRMLSRYGISVDQYDAMSMAQNNLCAICRQPQIADRMLSVDHCHGRGDVRGLLCVHCNAALGLAQDSPWMLEAMRDYLLKWKTVNTSIGARKIGDGAYPFILAEAGINHGGSVDVALDLVREAAKAGADAIKFQAHCDDELSPDAETAVPGNSGGESIASLIRRCSLTEEEDARVMALCAELGIVYMSTPFSVEAVDRLERLGVVAYKVGSGTSAELLKYIASKGKPVLLSTGMSTVKQVRAASIALSGVPHVLMECTSEYPTPYEHVRLGVLDMLKLLHPHVGLSDHSKGIWTALGAVARGASVVEKHFYCSSCPPGPDIEVSINPDELAQLVIGSRAIHDSLGGSKDEILPGEADTLSWFKASRR